MTTITIPQRQYHALLDKALRYEYLRRLMEEDVLAAPPIRDVKKVIQEFKKTNRYSEQFLKSLERGLNRSSYFKQGRR